MTSDLIARLTGALQEAIYEITHLSAPRPDDAEQIYRPVIRKVKVDEWRAVLRSQIPEDQ